MSFGARAGASSAFLVALGVSACTLLYGPSNAELTGGGRDAATNESGTSGDANATSSSGDPPPSDAGPSAESGGDAGVTPFVCPANALLCDDFEKPDVNPFATQGGIAIVAGGHSSAHALSALLRANTDAPQALVTLTPAAHGGTFSFWFKATSAPPSDGINFRIGQALWGNACDWQLTWELFLDDAGLHNASESYDQAQNPSCGPVKYDGHLILAAPQVYDGNWHFVTVVMDASTTTRTTRTTVDATATVVLTLDIGRAEPPPSVSVGVGVPCVNTNSGCYPWTGPDYRVDFDQVTFTP